MIKLLEVLLHHRHKCWCFSQFKIQLILTLSFFFSQVRYILFNICPRFLNVLIVFSPTLVILNERSSSLIGILGRVEAFIWYVYVTWSRRRLRQHWNISCVHKAGGLPGIGWNNHWAINGSELAMWRLGGNHSKKWWVIFFYPNAGLSLFCHLIRLFFQFLIVCG